MAKFYMIIFLFISLSCDEIIDPVAPYQEKIEWPSLADSPWPVMHGDSQHTGRSPFVGPNLESVHLTVQMPFYLESSPTIDEEGNLYYMQGERNTNNELISLTPEGALRWSLSVPGDFRISSDPFTFSTEGDQFYVSGNDSLYAISPSGTIVWAYDAIGWIYTIVDNDDNVYFFHHAFNQFISVNKAGMLNWSIDLADYGITSPNHSLLPTMTKDGIIPIVGFTSPGNKMLLIPLEGELVTEVMLEEVVSTHLVSDSESHVYFGTSIGNVIKMSSAGTIRQTMALSDSLILIPDNSPALSSDGTMYLSIYDNPFTQIVGVQ